jgi:DNA-binding HxlR family transcriptional regulator
MQTARASGKRTNKAMVNSVIALFGDRWATLVVRACFSGLHRFDQIQRDTLMATNILADRLDRLQTQGIIRARAYSAHQDRFEYRLTEKGRDLYPVLLALLEWGDMAFANANGVPLLLTHRNCGQKLHLHTSCGACGAGLNIGNTAFQFSPSRDQSALPQLPIIGVR